MLLSVFERAIDDGHGSVDPGYLAIFWTMAVTVAAVPLVLVVGGVLAFKYPDHASEILMGTAAIVGALGAQCAAVIGAVGVFRVGDKNKADKPVVAEKPVQ